MNISSFQVLALGCGREHLMDAISQCEQEVKRKGGQEQHTPWHLSFRKEIFTPWHDCKEDKISTQLIYKQILHGLKFGEYRCPRVSIYSVIVLKFLTLFFSPHCFNHISLTQEDDYVQLAAKHLYVQHGADSSPENVKEAVKDCISASLLRARSEAKWVEMVSTAHAEVGQIRRSNIRTKQF